MSPTAWVIICLIVVLGLLAKFLGPSLVDSAHSTVTSIVKDKPTIYIHNDKVRQAIDGDGKPMHIKDAMAVDHWTIPAGDLPYRD